MLAATNRLDLIDCAFLRLGRVDYVVELPIPDEPSRLAILEIHSRDRLLGNDVSLPGLACGVGRKVRRSPGGVMP